MSVDVRSEKTPFVLSWFRSQFVSVTATGVDFLVTISLMKLASVWYLTSNVMGAISGGIVSFTLCRLWAFNQRSKKWHFQALRYVLAIALSVFLNTCGVWFFTENFGLFPITSKIISAALVGISVNFFVFRYFVFR